MCFTVQHNWISIIVTEVIAVVFSTGSIFADSKCGPNNEKIYSQDRKGNLNLILTNSVILALVFLLCVICHADFCQIKIKKVNFC